MSPAMADQQDINQRLSEIEQRLQRLELRLGVPPLQESQQAPPPVAPPTPPPFVQPPPLPFAPPQQPQPVEAIPYVPVAVAAQQPQPPPLIRAPGAPQPSSIEAQVGLKWAGWAGAVIVV